MIDLINFISRGGAVTRYHTEHTIKTQTVAEHSFGVAWWCWMITEGRASAALLMGALAHDIAEHMTGDIPAPTKRAMNLHDLFEEQEKIIMDAAGIAIQELEAYDRHVLKLADVLDGMAYCLREARLGNTTLRPVFGRYAEYAAKLPAIIGAQFNSTDVIELLETEYESLA